MRDVHKGQQLGEGDETTTTTPPEKTHLPDPGSGISKANLPLDEAIKEIRDRNLAGSSDGALGGGRTEYRRPGPGKGAACGPQDVGKALYTIDEVSYHCSPESCWIVLWDHVYDITDFIKQHPGGEDIIYEHAGRDATFSFTDVGHSNDALLMVLPYQIGVLVESDRIFKRKKSESANY